MSLNRKRKCKGSFIAHCTLWLLEAPFARTDWGEPGHGASGIQKPTSQQAQGTAEVQGCTLPGSPLQSWAHFQEGGPGLHPQAQACGLLSSHP